jgi:hypothetical protein
VTTSCVIDVYLDPLDARHEAAFAALDGLSDARIWQRPALRLYHTQLHYDDAIKLARLLKGAQGVAR